MASVAGAEQAACITNTRAYIKVSSVEAGRSTEASIQTFTAARSPLSPGPKSLSIKET